MDFSEFAGRLRPIIGSGDNTKIFTRTLFSSIIDSEHESILDSKSLETYKAYFNGETGITELAKKIVTYIDPELFVEYIDEFPDAVAESICNSFKDVIPDIDNRNYCEKIAYLFGDIIKSAAATKRKSPTKKQTDGSKVEMPPPNVENGEGDTDYSEHDDLLLKEFQEDYDEIIRTCISDRFAQAMLDGVLLTRIADLFGNKWRAKSEQFEDMGLKSNIQMLLVKLNEFCIALDPKVQKPHSPIRTLQKNIRNLNMKLHPDEYLGIFPYCALMDDWDEGEYY